VSQDLHGDTRVYVEGRERKDRGAARLPTNFDDRMIRGRDNEASPSLATGTLGE
jgi:hypothetical protein